MIIGIGSTNPVKVAAVEEAVDLVHERLGIYGPVKFQAMEVESGVGAQPLSDEETRAGAAGRARQVLNSYLQPDIAVGLEGGVDRREDGLYATGWVSVQDQQGKIVEVNGACFKLPDQIAQPILDGEEMGVVMDQLTGKSNLKHQEGMIGTVTGGAVTRQESFQHLIQLAYGMYRQQVSTAGIV